MESLDRPFTEKEISNAVFSLPKGKALGPDGYPSEFYQTFWDLIKSDICKFFNQFHAGNTDISRLNYTFISLIPKKQEYDQATFIKGRQISDSFLTVAEIISHNRRIKTSGVLLKLDFEKAFDMYVYCFNEKNRYQDKLPNVDVFVCTADPMIEPPAMVINTVLSVMAYEYSPEKLSVYLSDDAGSELTFYALLEASCFAKSWIPFCKKFKVEPRSPAAYFKEERIGPKDGLQAAEWEKTKSLYTEMENRINDVVKFGKVSENIRQQHRGFLEWNRATTSQDHQAILHIFIDGRDKNAIDDEGFTLPTLVYMAREKRPYRHHNFKAGAMNSLLSLSLSCILCYISNEQVCDIWFVPFSYVITATTIFNLWEALSIGYTMKQWWNEQRMYLFKRLASYSFAFIDTILKHLGLNKSTFIITAKVADDEVLKRYEQEIMEFGSPSPMFTVLATLAMLNLVCLIGGTKRLVLDEGIGLLGPMLLQFVLCGSVVLINMPVYQAMFFRNDAGCMPTSITLTSVALAMLAYIVPEQYFRFPRIS
uniref:Cellulose synthase-like protein E6 n=1 Tax=Elaeis guineensis var. tenera TaxID=51953 RepID=A0A8N4IA50_ELAGV|nr:cellulose synthase-like protein E6 [Elaeis guineensis]